MMGKASRRKGDREPKATENAAIHEAIAKEARAARESPAGLADEGYPALTHLLKSAQLAVSRSAPRYIMYEGRMYWCRVSHGMSLIEVFDSPACAEPMARTICGSMALHGHTPGN